MADLEYLAQFYIVGLKIHPINFLQKVLIQVISNGQNRNGNMSSSTDQRVCLLGFHFQIYVFCSKSHGLFLKKVTYQLVFI